MSSSSEHRTYSDPLELDPIPEGLPRGVGLGQLVASQPGAPTLVAGPVGGAGEPVGDVEAVEFAPIEVPLAVHPQVGVPVLEHSLGPLAPVGVLELIVAVHDPVGVVSVVEVDDVIANEMARRLGRAHGGRIPALEGVTAEL